MTIVTGANDGWPWRSTKSATVASSTARTSVLRYVSTRDGLRVEPSFEQIEERCEMTFAGGLVPCRGVRHRVAVRGAFVDLRPVRHPRLVEGRFERRYLLGAVARILVGVAEVQLSFQPGSGTMR